MSNKTYVQIYDKADRQLTWAVMVYTPNMHKLPLPFWIGRWGLIIKDQTKEDATHL